MANSYAMGIDLGGNGVRCLLLNLATGETQHTERSWAFAKSDDGSGLGFDINLPQLWSLLGEASRELLAGASIGGEEVASIAVSAMRFTTVVIDAAGEALFAVPNRDARASMEYFVLAESHGEKLLQKTGLWPLPIQFSPRLLWLKAQQPELLARADCIFSLADWLNFRLSGVRATDYSQAGCSGLFDLAEQRWHDELIAELGFDRMLFPAPRAAGAVLGQLSAEAAEHLGLSPATCVGLGGGDTQCSLLAAGAVSHGDYACVAGTTAPVLVVLEQPLVDAQCACWSGQHLLPDRWLLESSGGPMGETLQWMSRLLFPEAPQPELRLFAEAGQSEYGARGMLSSLGAELMNAKSPSLPAGMIAMTHLSSADEPNPRRHLCRAVVEGYAAAVRANIERLAAISDTPLQTLRLTDGMSKSVVFQQLLADFCGRELIPAAQALTAATGAAICGAAAARGEALAGTAARLLSLSEPAARIKPDAQGQQQAQQVYADWCALRDAASTATAPRIADHMLAHVFRPAQNNARASSSPPTGLSALVTAAFDERSLQRLRSALEVKYASFRESGRLLTGPDMVKAMQDKQILITEIDIVDAKTLQQLPNLRVVAACRGNAVNVDVEACTAFGVPVICAPGRNALAVADLTVAFMLMQARKLTAAAEFLKDETVSAGNMGKMGQAFGSLQGNELWRKTIGLIGLGAVGRMVAARLSGFGARIVAADPFATAESAALAGVELVSLNTLLQESDFVSLHAAVTPATTGMMGSVEFALMKPTAFLINTARAALVDESALIDAVLQNTIAGAALDTFDEEPPGWDHPLVQHPHVLSTPHVAGNTVEVAAHQGESVTDALLQLLHGERPDNCLNPEVLDHFSFSAQRKTLSEAELAALLAKPPPAVTDLEKNKKQKVRSAQTVAASASPQIIANMTAILAAFCERMAADEKVAIFAADKDVCLAFTASDIGVSFYFGLHGGTVTSALGENDKAEVMLTMRAEILDGMFSGSIDTMKAAMNGDIAFVGDAAKAMTIQQMSRDMKRLYTGVIGELGSPGDLSAIPRPGKENASATIIAGPRDARHELVDIVNELYEHYIITATGGNVSVRNPDNPDECWITPSQMFKGDLRPELMVRINLDGKPLDAGSRSPSSEWGFHTQTLRKKKAANAVIHAHAPNATILANCGIPFLPISSDAAFFGDIQRIPFIMPGSNELAERVSDALREEWAVFMVNHGIVVAGKSLRRACDMAQIIERTAEVILGCYQASGGKAPSVLPDEAVKLFRSLADVIA